MPKSIHERVRAAIAKREKDAKRAAQTVQNRRTGALQAADTRRERRIEALIAGTADPRNAKEQLMVYRLEHGSEELI